MILRDSLTSDIDYFVQWLTAGEWRLFDAPWEGVKSSLTREEEVKIRRNFLEQCDNELPSPRKRATIAFLADRPIGWVSRYSMDRFPNSWFIGIDICEDEFLGQGLGTEALGLWVDYLFSHSSIHRIGLDTWSMNPRMIRSAEKLGFVSEGAQREILQWEGKWLDWVHFGITRSEWEKKWVSLKL